MSYAESVIDRIATRTGIIALLCCVFTVGLPFIGMSMNVPFKFTFGVQIAFVSIAVINVFWSDKHD